MRERPNNKRIVREMHISNKGWDGYDAPPIDYALIRLWENLVKVMDSPKYDDCFWWVAPCPDGSVGMDAEKGDRGMWIFMEDTKVMEVERSTGVEVPPKGLLHSPNGAEQILQQIDKEDKLPAITAKFSIGLFTEMLDWLNEGKDGQEKIT